MENKSTILNELMEISPLVAKIPRENLYEMPLGYFESLPAILLDLTQPALSAPLPEGSNSNPYSVPANYFESLPGTILGRIKSQEASSAKEEIEHLSPLLSGLNKNGPYSIPPNYFHESLENVVQGAMAINLVNEELEILSPLMVSLRRENVYEVPQRYFDAFPTRMIDRAKGEKSGRLVYGNFRRKVFRYAVAAVTVGIVFLGGWFYMNKGVSTSSDVVAGNIPEQEIQAYLESEPANQEAASVNLTAADIDADDMKDMLADVSDVELQQYVEQNGGNTKSVTN